MIQPESTPQGLSPFPLARVTPPDGNPYEALAAFGVSYDSSMSEVHRSGINAQRQKALTPERRQAWNTLKDPARRLAVDLLHVQTDPCLFGDVPADDQSHGDCQPPTPRLPALPEPDPATICETIGILPLPEPDQPTPLTGAVLADAPVWAVLREACPTPPPKLPPLPEPDSFLEDVP